MESTLGFTLIKENVKICLQISFFFSDIKNAFYQQIVDHLGVLLRESCHQLLK